MENKTRHIVSLLVGLLFLLSCKPSIPPEVIQPDEMEELLYDYHISQGMAYSDVDNNYKRRLYFESVLKKHGITHAEFDSSLVYYYTRADYFMDIYKRVQERLGDEALEMGTSASEVERYSTLSLNGDTADIWEGNRQMILMNCRPYHLVQFSLKADTAYHAGDSFLLTFTNTYLSQNSNKPLMVYMAVTYANDSTVTQNTTTAFNGTISLRISPCDERVKTIRGFIHLQQRPDEHPGPNDMCMMSLDGVRLIRFHKKETSPEPTKQAPVDSVRNDVKADSLADDSVKKPVRRFGQRPISDMHEQVTKDLRPIKPLKPITR